jgi:hypothetical protein
MPEPRPGAPLLAPERAAQIRSVVLAEITRSAGRPARTGRRLAVAVAAGVVGVAVAAGSAAAWVSVSRPDRPNEAYCSSSVTLDRDVWGLRGVAAATSADGRPDTVSAVDACTIMWQMDRGGPPSSTGTKPAGHTAACIVEGTLVIYPDPTACRTLGVPRAETVTLDPSTP